jgi:hypothetical protein
MSESRFSLDKANHELLRDLSDYLDGLAQITVTRTIEDKVIVDRQYLHALIEPARKMASELYCNSTVKADAES